MPQEESPIKMAPTRVILMSCGSYNPPTHMHLRMFETARDHLHRMGTHIVVGGVISPTHDDYRKKELASAEHRCAMLKLATQDSEWIRVSTWETRQNGWTKTRLSFQHHQNLLNSVLLDTNDIKHRVEIDDMDWIPENVKNSTDRSPIQIKFLCGADLLESFGTPGLWAEEDIDAIVGQHGLVVITRGDSNPSKFIYDSDILSKYMHNIHIVTEWMRNEVSSTKIRRALRRGESVRYHVQDSVIEYIYKHGMYDAKTVSTIKLELSPNNGNDYLSIRPKYQSAFLTPSPSDVTMTTPSPVEIISIDISESVFKRNFQNSPTFSKGRSPTCVEDTERMRDKFISAITENGNKLMTSNKAAYPGQAKQIIATETGETQIFCEVGLSCITEKLSNEMEVDDVKAERVEAGSSLDSTREADVTVDRVRDNERISTCSDLSVAEVFELVRSSDQTITPDDSEGKVSVILSIDVVPCSESPDEPLESSLDGEKLTSNEKLNGLEEIVEAESNADEGSPISNDGEPTATRCKVHAIESSAANAKTDDVPNEIDVTFSTQQETERSEERSSSKTEARRESIERADARTEPEESIPQTEAKITGSSLPATIEESPISEEKTTGLVNDPDSSKNDSTTEEILSKHESVIEIDGKYLKSLVNSRKSPKKITTNEQNGKEEQPRPVDASELAKRSNVEAELDKSSNTDRASAAKSKDVEDAVRAEVPSTPAIKSAGRRRGVLFQGSLDSINVSQPRSSGAMNSHQPISKKSKSYEFIKPTQLQPTSIYKISLTDLKDNPASSCEDSSRIKSDSTSVFTTANDAFEAPTDEFCSVCCYANEPSSTEVFYTLRSTGSSPIEDTTECDICSNCDLQEAGDSADFKAAQPAPGEPVCELCEICGDAAMDEDVVASSRPEKDDFVDRRMLVSRPLPLSLPKKKKAVVRLSAKTFDDIDDDEDNFEIENCGVPKRPAENVKIPRSKSIDEHSTDNTNSNDDEFEIENCGLDLDLEFENVAEPRYEAEVEDTFRNVVPRDEVAMSGKSFKKITRAGSLVSRATVDRSKTKRRYSSVDNLPNSRQVVKSSPEKQNPLRSRGLVKGLVASADNIRPTRSSRSRSLRKSADDVGRGYHSSVDDTREEAPLYENVQRKKSDAKDQHKPRDSGTIKMILTKHGIKIISDKETAL